MKERFLGESFLRPTYGHYYSTGHYDDYERLPTIPELHRAARDGDTSAIKRLIDNVETISMALPIMDVLLYIMLQQIKTSML
jgi:hypothetical protein